MNGPKSLIGRILFDHLGLALTQFSSSQGNQVNNIPLSSEFKEHIAKNFSYLISRIGSSIKHMVKSNFDKDFQHRHQKGRRIPINLQNKVNNKLKKIFDEKRIIKCSSCPDKFFISPIVVTVQRDQTVELAMDSNSLNKTIHKNKLSNA